MITAKQALLILKPIPSELFTTNTFYNRETEKSCAIGWIRRKLSKETTEYGKATNYLIGQELFNSSIKFLEKYHNADKTIIQVNDTNEVNGYIEDNPKDRVVHLLTDMVKAGY